MLTMTASNLDLAAVERTRNGDDSGFSQLVESYQRAIYNLCYRLLGNPHEAEEAAQEAFLRAYTRLNSYDAAQPFKTWLFSIAHHHCIDRLRRRRLVWLSLDDQPALEAAAWRSPAPSLEDIAMRREQADDIQALLAALPSRDRSTLIMRYWYDMSYEEIAAVTSSTVSAVKSRLHRARSALAAEIAAPAQGRSQPLRPSVSPVPARSPAAA